MHFFCRMMYVLITTLMYIMAKIGVTIYAGAILFETVTGN